MSSQMTTWRPSPPFSSSLIQYLDKVIPTKASEVADRAIRDMSDEHANTFGTDIGSIQNAYQEGFAKSTYTMLDNLKS